MCLQLVLNNAYMRTEQIRRNAMKRRVCNLLSIVLFGVILIGNLYAAVPTAPTELKVVPVYTTNTMKLTWVDNANNETNYNVERKTGSGSYSLLTILGSNVQQYLDNTVATSTEYTYRVYASNGDGNSGYSNESTNKIDVAWPLSNGSHEMMNGWQDGTPNNIWGFHEGMDVQDDGSGGQTVESLRGGIIKRKDQSYAGGHFAVEVENGANTFYDRFLHIQITTAKVEGEVITPGENVGTISTTAYSNGARHVHTALLNSWVNPNGFAGDGSNFCNPFSIYTADADKDPLGNAPGLEDMDGDGHTILYKRPDNSYITNGIIYEDVDICAEMADNMGSNPRQNARKVGYWVDGSQAGGDDIQSAGTPYWLYNFDQWFGQNPPNTNFDNVYDPDKSITSASTGFPKRFHIIVTNTKGTDGSVGNLDASQLWRTDARKASGIVPNGSNAQRARENQEAKFPDGTYYVHIKSEDMIHSSDNVQSVLIDNSRPYVKRVTVRSGLQPVYQAQWAWNAATAQLSIQPSTFDAAASFSALRTQDINIEVEFSEPMQSASIVSILPLGVTPTLTSTQSPDARTIWTGMISNLDIADDGSDDGVHKITFDGTDLAGNQLLQIHDRISMPADHHNKDATGALRGTPGTDNIHGFKIGPLTGAIPITAIFMKQSATDPITPTIDQKAAQIQQALNTYFSEVSYSSISFSVIGNGWYQLSHPTDWYYTTPQTPLIDLVQEAIDSAQSSGVDLTTTNYILVVTDDATTSHGEWSTNGGWSYIVSAAPGWRLIAGGTMMLASSDAHVTNLVGRWVGLIDLFAYPYVTVSRPFVGPWSHMSDKENQVHVLGWEKWRAGWLDETGNATNKTLTRVPKPPVASPIVNQPYTILPLDKNDNGTKMVAIEAGDRLHYTVEYRRRQHLDAALPDTGVLVVKANDYVNQGEGPAIVQESPVTAGNLNDATFNLTPSRNVFNDVGSGINIAVTSMNANQAQIQLNYQVPPTENDVYVAHHDNRWKTEDIWIDAPDINSHYAADPLSVKDANEKPVIGMVNKVYGRVRNQGHADATNFEVHLDIREPWGAGGPWRSLNVVTVPLLQGQDHDPNAYFLIEGDWTPSSDGEGHSCVQLTVTGVANDVNPDNNWTQENITEFATSPGSPYAPVTTRFEVENPYNDTRPIFFKLDGLPKAWSYILTPQRLVVPPKGVGKAQVTIQPNEAAPVCSNEQITITAYTPQVDALQRLGAITLQIDLKNKVNISQKSWVECGGNYQAVQTKQYTTKREASSVTHQTDITTNSCVVYSQGCTDPKLANTQIAVVYTSPDGQKQVHYVTTDENGCYLDLITAGDPGLWQTQAVIKETDCQAEGKSNTQTVNVEGGGTLRGPWTYLAAFGPNFPLGKFREFNDPGFSFNIGAERSIRQNLSVVALIGFHQFYSQTQNQHFVQATLDAKYVYYRWSDKFSYVIVGGGVYIPRYGSSSTGGNVGAGLTWPLTNRLGLDLHVDYHLISLKDDRMNNAQFADIQMGIIWSY
jgi:hypothetical protein